MSIKISDNAGWIRRLVRRLACVLTGHPCKPTGRHGYLLFEHKCQRCGGVYVSHIEHGNALIPADADSDRIFSNVKWLECIHNNKDA